MSELLAALGGGVGVGILILAYVLTWPEKAERIFGWIAGLVARVFRRADRAAVAYKVQGDVNTARAAFLRNGPNDLIEKKLKVKWADAEEAEALIKNGEVLVVMRRSEQHEENIAHALMAYLPKAMLPRARRYVDRERMRAADLIIAKSVLTGDETPSGALPVFFDKHLDPARAEGEDLRQKITELDEIDLQGWLSRVLLMEYRLLGDELHPGEPDQYCREDAEEFARWLHRLAARQPGAYSSLTYTGRYFRIAVIWVAIKEKLAEQGLVPYRKRAKRYLYQERFDAVYLMGRDDNISAVEELANDLETDGRVASATRYDYRCGVTSKSASCPENDR
jgi:hypothetical protein